MNEAHNHSRVTPEGLAIGAQLAKISDKGCQVLAAEGEPDDRCRSCAFVSGTVPNGCLQTQMDAMKATVEGVPFMCHQGDRRGLACHGWYGARVAVHRAEQARGTPLPATSCPWDFSPPDEAP